MNRDQELESLRDWKAQMLQVESQWDEQQIAKLLGAKPGQSCRKVIQEKVPQLVETLRVVGKALEDAHEHLSYCGYGDKWERECAGDLDDRITSALTKFKQTTP